MSAQRFLLETDPSGAVTQAARDQPAAELQGNRAADEQRHVHRPLCSTTPTTSSAAPVFALRQPTDDLTNREDAPEYVWLLQWRHLFGLEHLRRGEVHRLVGVLRSEPRGESAGALRRSAPACTRCRRAGSITPTASATRSTARVTHYADKFGRHEFKFGAELERSKTRDRYGYNDGISFYDYYGASVPRLQLWLRPDGAATSASRSSRRMRGTSATA